LDFNFPLTLTEFLSFISHYAARRNIMRNMQTERPDRLGRHLVCAVQHGCPQAMFGECRRGMSNMPQSFRLAGEAFRILAAVPGVFSAKRPAAGPMSLLLGQNSVGYSNRLREFRRAHAGHGTSSFSSRHRGVDWGIAVSVGTRGHALVSNTKILHPQFFSAGVYGFYNRRIRKLD
jgi:hypothetical protein